MVTTKQLWDTINEGGEGYRPDYVRRVATPAVITAPQGRTHTKAGVPIAKLQARLEKQTAALATVTDASARKIIEAAIASIRAELS